MERSIKKSLKSHIYERDGRCCFFCGASLKYHQFNLDHYYPRSCNGPDAVYNLVCSCRPCNRNKGSRIPDDYGEVLITNLIRAAADRKITVSGKVKISYEELLSLLADIERVEAVERDNVIFQSFTRRFYFHRSRLVKIINLSVSEEDS